MTGIILFRAQPFHNGHLAQIKRAYEDIRKIDGHLYIIVGSADKVGTQRNPIPIAFRIQLIDEVLRGEYSYKERQYIHVIPLNDFTDEANNSHEWGRYLYYNLCALTLDKDFIIYYSDKPEIMLSWFDEEILLHIAFKFLPRYANINATIVRQHLKVFEKGNCEALKEILPSAVYERIDELHEYIINAK